MKKIVIIIAVSAASLLALGIFKDQIIRGVATVVVSRVTGAPARIGGLSLGLMNKTIRVTNFKLYNPEGFKKGVMVDIPKIHVAYDLGALMKKKLYFYSADFRLKELNLQRNQDGQLNVDSLKVAKKAEEKEAGEEEKPAAPIPMQIDHLKLGIGKIVYKDNSGPQPTVTVYDVNIYKEYKNITSVQQLVILILTEPLKQAGIQGAKIYGAAMLAGVAVLPVAAVATFMGRSSGQQEFARSFDRVYEASLSVLKKSGTVSQENKSAGAITGIVNGADISVQVNKIAANRTEVTVTARRFFLPKPEIADGIVYQISDKLK